MINALQILQRLEVLAIIAACIAAALILALRKREKRRKAGNISKEELDSIRVISELEEAAEEGRLAPPEKDVGVGRRPQTQTLCRDHRDRSC